MTFAAKFKKANTKIAASSVRTYLANIKRLAKMSGASDIPENGKWLSKKGLLASVKKLPLNARKILSAAAVAASRVYGVKVPTWEKLMRGASREYDGVREKRKRTKREKDLWVDYGDVFKAGKKLWDSVKEIKTFAQARKAQAAYLLLLYGKHTPRLLESLVRPGHEGKNQMRLTKGKYNVILRDYKTAKSRGVSKFTLDAALQEPTKRYLEAAERLYKHKFMFTNAKNAPLSKSGFSSLLTASTRRGGLKGVSAQLLRVFKSSDPSNKALIEKARALEDEMGHGSREAKRYAKKG